MATTRRWCDSHRDMGPHDGARCLTCEPDAPPPVRPRAVALEMFARKPKAIDVIRAAGDRGATVREIKDAGADPMELFDLELESEIEQQYRGQLVTRGGLTVWYAVGRKEGAA